MAPTSTDLTYRPVEQTFLVDLLAAHDLRNTSPATAQRRVVLQLLRTGDYDWFHVIAHGAAPATNMPGTILLEDATIAPDDLIGLEVEGHIGAVRPGFVLNLCHGACEQWGISQLEGWANLLVGAGASSVVAPLWAITDARACAFTQALYCDLVSHQPVSAAVDAARKVACEGDDPTGFACGVYAHPNVRMDSTR